MVVQENLLEKKKRQSMFLMGIPTAAVLILFCFIPMFRWLLLAFREYSPMRETGGSPWVGLKNFQDVLSLPYFGKLVFNTLLLGGVPLAFGTILTFGLTVGISSVRKNWLQGLILGLAALPAAIPSSFWVNILPREILMNAQYSRLAAVVHGTLTFSAFGAVAGVLACKCTVDKRKAIWVAAGSACVGLMLVFSPSREYIGGVHNPAVYETMDVLDTFSYRKGLMETQYGYDAAVTGIKTLFQLFSGTVGAVGLILLGSRKAEQRIQSEKSFWPAVLLAVLPAAAVIWMLAVQFGGEKLPNDAMMQAALVRSLGIGLAAAVLLAGFGGFAACSLCSGSRIAIVFFMLGVVFSGGVQAWYFQARIVGLVNTLPAVVMGMIPGCAAFGFFLYLSAGKTGGIGILCWIKENIPSLIAAAGFAFAAGFGNSVLPRALLTDREKYPLSLIWNTVRMAQTGGTAEGNFSMPWVVLIPAAVVFAGVFAAVLVRSRRTEELACAQAAEKKTADLEK